MTPARRQKIERVYHAALERPPGERAAFLAEVCEQDAELHREIESLLAQPSETGALDHPAWEGKPGSLDETKTQFTPELQFGPYRIEGKIGEGGMGVVLLALDTRLMRRVALKVLRNDLNADATLKRRFLQEARAASALNHPNIVVVFDISTHNGTDFLVMEYVAGKTLQDLIPPGGLPLPEVAGIGAQVSSALAAAHAAGLVHRDVKPANVIVAPGGMVKVLDFGIAKPMHPAGLPGLSTTPGMIVGTLSYMSPEQTRGEAVKGSSDIFSLGTVLYQAATGCLPFKSDSALGVMHAIAHLEPPAPSTLHPDLPAKFDALIARCLAKLPEDRPASAADLAEELRGFADPAGNADRARLDRSAVAVLPFLLRASSAEDEYLSVALADAIIHRLSSSTRLLVRPTVSVMRYAGREADWAQVARDLNLDLVVDGTIQKAGSKIRVMVRVHRVWDARVLLSSKMDGETSDLFGLQDRLTEAVFNALLTGEPSEKRDGGTSPPKIASASPVAYELFLRAAERVTKLNKWDTQSAIEMLTRATGIDPSFTEAWARLAQACVQMGVVFDGDAHWFRMAEAAVARTLALDISHADALCARGQILWSPHHSYQNRQALRALNGALKLNPGCHTAQIWRGLILFHLGLYAEAKEGLEEALAKHPDDPRALVFLGQTALYRGDYEEAREFNGRALAADPASVWPQLFYPTIPLYLGRPSEAAERLRTAREMVPQEPTLISVEGMIAAHEGQFQKAERLADEALGHKVSLLHTHHLWHNAAAVFTMCGKPEKAVPLLRRCAEMGLPNYLLFRSDPHLAPLRENPDFGALMSDLRVEYESHRDEFGFART